MARSKRVGGCCLAAAVEASHKLNLMFCRCFAYAASDQPGRASDIASEVRAHTVRARLQSCRKLHQKLPLFARSSEPHELQYLAETCDAV